MFILLSATLENSYLYEIVSQHLSRSYWVSQWVKYWPSAQVLPLESGIKPSIGLPVQGGCFSLCPSPKSCLLCRIRKICLKKCFLRGCPPLGIPCVPSRSPLEPRVTVPNIVCGADCLSQELRMQTSVCPAGGHIHCKSLRAWPLPCGLLESDHSELLGNKPGDIGICRQQM